MFIKILSRHTPSYKQLLQYILKEKDTLKPITNLLTHNFKTDTIKGLEAEFLQNEAYRRISRSDQIMLYHEILSLSSNEDVYITDEVLTDLTQKYIELRGHDGMFVSSFHRDQEHAHIHLATSPLKFKTGHAFSLSKAHLQEIKLELQQYHKTKYPELTESFCKHGKVKEYLTDRKYHAKTKQNRANLKEEIKQKVSEIFTQSKSIDAFLSKLKENGLQIYERNNIATGILIEDIKIRFTRLGIEKSALESLYDKQNEIDKNELKTNQIPVIDMKTTEINFPQDTEEVHYNIKPDEFENYVEQEKQNQNDLDRWIEENLPNPQPELVSNVRHQEELNRRNKRDLDIEHER